MLVTVGEVMVFPESSARSISGYLGMLTDADDGPRRKVYALIFTAVVITPFSPMRSRNPLI